MRETRRGPRFIVDAMLGKLVTWLRLLGYDTVYARDWPDGRILEYAQQEGRILITRDHGLYVRARRRGIEAVMVGDDRAEALALLAHRYGIRLRVDPSRSRCPRCNAPLREASPEEVKGRVPPAVYAAHDVFWVCTRCGQVYWRGGHWRGIEETLARARRLLEELRTRGKRRGSAIEGLATEA